MISPEYLSRVLGLLQVHKEYTESVYADTVRRLVKTDFHVSQTAAYQTEILQQSGMCYNDIITRIAAEKNKIGNEIKKAFENAETEIFDCDDEILSANGIEPIRFKSLSPEMSKIYKAALGRTTNEILNLTGTTANTAQTAYINSCNLAHMQLASGAFDYRTAIKNAIISAAKHDVSVIYPSGHISSLDSAVRRAVLTGLNTTVIRLQEMRADEFDVDIMELTAHFGARPTHAEWQGQLVSRSGKSGFLSLDDIGYGRVDGFMGANCRHDWNLFFEGYSSRHYSDEELSQLKNAEVRYNGETIPAYEAIQKQRAMERSVKEVKRELVCINEGIKHTTNKDLSQELTAEFEKKAVRLKQRENKLADFCEQTGLARDRFREAQFAVKTEKELAAWTKSVSGKAVAANKWAVDKYSKYHYNKDGTIRVTDTAKHFDKTYKPFAVCDMKMGDSHKERTLYDAEGKMIKQINPTNHNKPKHHPYGEHGEHAHDFVWEDEKIKVRTTRELTDSERKEHADIL